MKILAIDCSLKITGVALSNDGIVIDSEKIELGRRQSGELPFMTKRILESNNLSWNDLNYIALTNGPGYFTGIRVGAAYASGLAFGIGIKLITVSSIEMLANSFLKKNKFHENKKFLVMIYAGHGFVYAESFGFEKDDLSIGEYSHEKINSWLKIHDDANIISDDFSRINFKFENENDNKNKKIFEVIPDVNSLCEVAYSRLESAIEPMNLKISYYRSPQGMS